MLKDPPTSLRDRLDLTVKLYPCEVLFVHRDAEGQAPELRYKEIKDACPSELAFVSVVPVRMQEAWLLHDEVALREAAGRPSGRDPLDLPSNDRWERVADAKEVLHTALRIASGTTGRKARRFNPSQATHRLADLITDWSALRSIQSFNRLEDDTRCALEHIGVQVHQ